MTTLFLSGEKSVRNALIDVVRAHGHPLPAGREVSMRSVAFSGIERTPELEALIMPLAETHRLDYAFIPEGVRLHDFRLLAMDMDSTLITIECIDEIAAYCGLKDQVAAITAASMRGEIPDFAESLRQRTALLAGLPMSALEEVYDARLALSPGALPLLEGARAARLKTLLVSGGFTFFTERLRQRLGLDFTRANLLEVHGGRLTGRLLGEIVDADVKARTLAAVCDELGTTTAHALVIGDGANDLKMMGAAGISVAFHAKPIVMQKAKLSIRFGPLDTLLDWLSA